MRPLNRNHAHQTVGTAHGGPIFDPIEVAFLPSSKGRSDNFQAIVGPFMSLSPFWSLIGPGRSREAHRDNERQPPGTREVIFTLSEAQGQSWACSFMASGVSEPSLWPLSSSEGRSCKVFAVAFHVRWPVRTRLACGLTWPRPQTQRRTTRW